MKARSAVTEVQATQWPNMPTFVMLTLNLNATFQCYFLLRMPTIYLEIVHIFLCYLSVNIANIGNDNFVRLYMGVIYPFA